MKKNLNIMKAALAIFAFIMFPILISGQSTPANQNDRAIRDETGLEQADIWEVFQNRRSVRKFRPDAVPEEKIRKMIDAARMSPTSGNQQPWKFLVVKDRKLINRMLEGCVRESLKRFEASPTANETRVQYEERVRKTLSSGYFSAPVFIAVLTDNNSKYPDYNIYDGPLAAGYLMLAARALGYGTVFITDGIPVNVTTEVLGIPDNYTLVCITPVGIPLEWPPSPPKKDLNEFIVIDKF